MAGPWEQYQQGQAPAPQAGPWMQYQKPPQAQEPAQPAPEQPGMLDQIGRQLGLTARYGMEGAGNLAGMVSDPFSQFMGATPLGQLATQGADAMGLPSPQGDLEQGVGNASRALVGTGLSVGGAGAVGAAEMAAQPLMQALGTMTGAGAQDAAKAAGAGAGGQMAAGLVGGLLPSAGTMTANAMRLGLRGGDAGRQTLANNIENFAAAGTTPTVGQGTERALPQFIESLLAKLPGSANVMARKGADQADEIGLGLSARANALSPGADAEMAGEAIKRGITGEGGWVNRFKETAGKLYDQLDKHVAPDTPIKVSATQKYLQQAVAPTKGAERTTSLLVNPKLREIDSALADDIAAAANGTLPYEAVKSLRSRVGAMQADANLVSDIPKAELKRLYGALSDDMKAEAFKTPGGAKAFNRADNFYRDGLGKLDKIEHVVQKAGGPEKVYLAAMSGTKDGATTLRNVMSSLKPSERDVVSATVLNRMGKATAGQQGTNVEGAADRFSASTFLTEWSKMSPQARSTLFDHKGPKFREDMNKISQVATNLRDGSKVFANASGSSQGAAQIGTVAALVTSAMSGNLPAAAGIAATVAGTNLSARLMTNPKFVGWLAKQNRPISSLPGQIGVLANIGKDEPDIQEFIAQLSQAGNQQQQQ